MAAKKRVRARVVNTVSLDDPSEVDEKIGWLFEAVRS
jgi:hypothetical protein